MKQESSLVLKRIGLEVEVRERFSAEIVLSEADRLEAVKAPEEDLKRLLERSGQVVNRIVAGRWDLREDQICDLVHIRYPDEHKSIWTPVNCEPLRGKGSHPSI